MTAQLTDTGEIDTGSVKDLKLPPPDTHCLDDEGGRPIDVWSYSPELVRQIVAADRAMQAAEIERLRKDADSLRLDAELWRRHDAEKTARYARFIAKLNDGETS